MGKRSLIITGCFIFTPASRISSWHSPVTNSTQHVSHIWYKSRHANNKFHTCLWVV